MGLNKGLKHLAFLSIMLCSVCSMALSYYTNEEFPGVLLAEGTFEHADVDTFKTYINENNINTVMFSSNGGNLVASIDIGYFIRERNLNTLVPETGFCYSACAYAFMGGVKRTIDGAAPFAMHRPFFGDEMEGTYINGYDAGIVTSVMIVSYLIEMGMNPGIANLHLINKELEQFNVVEQRTFSIVTT